MNTNSKNTAFWYACTLAILTAISCFGQAIDDRIPGGRRDDSPLRIPPMATFGAPPPSPPAGAVFTFTDAQSLGSCVGGGYARATCRWTGAAWVPAAGVGMVTRATNTVVLIGDSLTGQNTPQYLSESTVYGYPADGYFNWANAMLGGGFEVVNFSGVSGNTAAQILARLDRDVIAFHPGWCIVLGGINDIVQGASSATVIATLTAIYNALNSAGIKTVMLTLPPTNAVGADPRWFAVNSWIKTFGASTPNLVVVDAAAAMVDPARAGTPAQSMTLDGVHFASLGGFSVGKAVAAALAGVVSPVTRIISNEDRTNLVTNGLQIGNAGTAADGASGSVSNGWTLTGFAGATCIASKGSRIDGMGGVQTITMTGTSANSYCELKQTIRGWTGTDKLQAQAEILEGSTIGKMVTTNLIFRGPADHVHSTMWQDNGTITLTDTMPDMLFRTPPQSVWQGTRSIDVTIWIYGTTSTVYIGRVEVHKL